jgi:hypothetical protein
VLLSVGLLWALEEDLRVAPDLSRPPDRVRLAALGRGPLRAAWLPARHAAATRAS